MDAAKRLRRAARYIDSLEFIAYAKANPGKLSYAATAAGSSPQLAMELFKLTAKVNIVHIAYKGAAPALQDVIAGHVQMMFATAASVVGHVHDGLVRPLAVTTLTRDPVTRTTRKLIEDKIRGLESSLGSLSRAERADILRRAVAA